jgi:hypothetical protein
MGPMLLTCRKFVQNTTITKFVLNLMLNLTGMPACGFFRSQEITAEHPKTRHGCSVTRLAEILACSKNMILTFI